MRIANSIGGPGDGRLVRAGRGRRLEAGERIAEDIIASTGNKEVLVAPIDLADQAFATNHLGHFALTTGLYDALAAGGARVVVVSRQPPGCSRHALDPEKAARLWKVSIDMVAGM